MTEAETELPEDRMDSSPERTDFTGDFPHDSRHDSPYGFPHDSLHDSSSREPVRHFKRLGRELAMQFLYQCEIAGTDEVAVALEQFWEQAETSGKFVEGRIFRKARNYAEKLIAGVLGTEAESDGLLEKHSQKWDIARMPPVDKSIMRVAIFELIHCPDIPAVVSIDEAIELSKEFGSEKSGVFVNGILNGVKAELPPDAKRSAPKKPFGEKK